MRRTCWARPPTPASAYQLGLREGDRVVAVGGHAVHSLGWRSSLTDSLDQHRPPVRLRVERGRDTLEVRADAPSSASRCSRACRPPDDPPIVAGVRVGMPAYKAGHSGGRPHPRGGWRFGADLERDALAHRGARRSSAALHRRALRSACSTSSSCRSIPPARRAAPGRSASSGHRSMVYVQRVSARHVVQVGRAQHGGHDRQRLPRHVAHGDAAALLPGIPRRPAVHRAGRQRGGAARARIRSSSSWR